MNYLEYLQKYQEIPYKIFKNSLEKDEIFHAYLLIGENGTPLLEIAKFLGASIIAGKNDYISQDDPIYKMIIGGNFPNLFVLDSKQKQIKIDDIRDLEARFSQTTSSTNPRKVYIINEINNLGTDSINALLKFLEEPKSETYAFITTENEFRVLPTIKSRTELIHFSLLEQNELINDSINEGVSKEDSELLSFFYNDTIAILENSSAENYIATKNCATNLLLNIKNSKKVLEITLNEVIKIVKDKISARYFFDFLIVFFKESLKYKINKETILTKYVNIITSLSSLKKLEDDIILLMNSRYEIAYNLNLNLLLITTINKILENEI